MARKQIRVFFSVMSGRFYAADRYREEKDRVVITGQKYDVTNDIAAAVIEHGVTFAVVPQGEPTESEEGT